LDSLFVGHNRQIILKITALTRVRKELRRRTFRRLVLIFVETERWGIATWDKERYIFSPNGGSGGERSELSEHGGFDEYLGGDNGFAGL
jgi:hypothetical protein